MLFKRKVPHNLCLADLHKLSFQAMKGQHFNFEMRSDGRVLSPSAATISGHSLVSGTSIDISIITPSEDTIYGEQVADDTFRVEPKEMFLVKAYLQRDNPLLCYWAPRDIKSSYASAIFRYWRYNAEAGLGLQNSDVELWSECRYTGDALLNGTLNRPWQKIWPIPTSGMLLPFFSVV